MQPFIVPITISEEQEFGFKGMPWFFTRSEWGLVMISPMLCYTIALFFTSNSLVQMAIGLIGFIGFAEFLKRARIGKPASYMWDARVGLGSSSPKKGWFQYKKRWSKHRKGDAPQPLDWAPTGRPSTFVPDPKRGEKTGFQASTAFRKRQPFFGDVSDPLLEPRRLFPVQRIQHFTVLDTTGSKDIYTMKEVQPGMQAIALQDPEQRVPGQPVYAADLPEPDGEPAPMWWREPELAGKFQLISRIPLKVTDVYVEMIDVPEADGDSAEMN